MSSSFQSHGDARVKGGSYSTNPNTMRTRAYNASLSPERSAQRKARFSQYRALRAVCIRVANTDEYKKEKNRNAKIAILRNAVDQIIARRAGQNKPVIDVDFDDYVQRFHDNQWAKRQRAAAKAGSSRLNTKAAEAILDDSKNITAGIYKIQATLSQQGLNIAQVVHENPGMIKKINLLTNHVHQVAGIVDSISGELNAFKSSAEVEGSASDIADALNNCSV